jgi:hypothetical protein
VYAYELPGASVPEANVYGAVVLATDCGTAEVFVQVTVVPAATLGAGGTNPPAVIETEAVCGTVSITYRAMPVT